MLIKIQNQIVELLEEEPPDNDRGLKVALGALALSFGIFAAVLAVL